jgi:hypothetical protein
MNDGAIPVDPQAVKDRYQQLHDAIAHARETCTELGERQRLRKSAEEVRTLITAMDQEDMASRTGAFEALGTQVQSANSSLEKLKQDIAGIVQDAAIAAKVVGAIDSAITTSAKLFL